MASRLIHRPKSTGFEVNKEMAKAIGHLADYMVVAPRIRDLDADAFFGFLLFEPLRIRLADQVADQSYEERMALAWRQVGDCMWSVLPPRHAVLGDQAADQGQLELEK